MKSISLVYVCLSFGIVEFLGAERIGNPNKLIGTKPGQNIFLENDTKSKPNGQSIPENIKIISEFEIIDIDGTEYSLGDLKKYDIIGPNFSASLDGHDYSKYMYSSMAGMYEGDVNNVDIFITKDQDGIIDFIRFHEINRTVNFVALKKGSQTTNMVAPLTSEDYAHNNLIPGELNVTKDGVKSDEIVEILEEDSEVPRDSLISTNTFLQQFRSKTSNCPSFQVIDIAVAFDSTFCAEYGTPQRTFEKILNIVGLASKKYQQDGLCMRLEITHLEGYCDAKTDPYAELNTEISGCSRKMGMLQDVRYRWNEKMTDVKRAASHVFTGLKFRDGYFGCAFTGTLCRNSWSYSLGYYTFTSNLDLQASIFAHEVGHTCGADHYKENTGNIMNTYFNTGSMGFSENSISDMWNYINRHASCLRTAGKERRDWFEIRDKKENWCIDAESSYNVVWMLPCSEEKSSQQWSINSKDKLIYNNFNGKCLKADGSLLSLRSCNSSSSYLDREWNIDLDGKIRAVNENKCIGGFKSYGDRKLLILNNCDDMKNKNILTWEFV